MNVSKRDAGYLWDMVQAISRIQEFTQDLSYEDYLANHLVQSGVERKLEILGEAAARISSELQQAQPNIDWRGTVGLRNIIIHRYNDVKADTIWSIVTSQIAPMKEKLEALLPPLDKE